MANPYMYQFLYSKHPMLSVITGSITFGATGAVSAASGNGVYGVVRKTTGIYQVKLTDNWPGFVKFQWIGYSGITGSNVASGSLVTGTLYQITAVGTTVWSGAGFDSDFTPAVGMQFVATGTAAGTGTAKAVTTSGIGACEVALVQTSMLQNNNPAAGRGSEFFLQTLDFAGALVDPTSGGKMGFMFWLRNSSSQY